MEPGSHEGGCGHDGQADGNTGDRIGGPVVSKMDVAGGGRQAATDPSGPSGDARPDGASVHKSVRRDWAEEESGAQGMTGGLRRGRVDRPEDGRGGGRVRPMRCLPPRISRPVSVMVTAKPSRGPRSSTPARGGGTAYRGHPPEAG